MKLKKTLNLTFLILIISSAAYAQGKCNHLTNPTAKRNCLQRQLDEANRQQRLAEEKLNRANLRMKQACDAVGALDQAVKLLSKFPNQTVVVGARTYRTVRTAAAALTRERRKCESAREEVLKSRSRQ